MSVEALTARSQGKRAAPGARRKEAEPRPVRSLVAAQLPASPPGLWPEPRLSRSISSLTRLRIRTLSREVPFWAIVGLLMVFAVNNGHFAGRVGGVDVWPVTYLMVQAVEGGARCSSTSLPTLYAAELIWRERDTHFDGIHDALPMGESRDWLSKLTAIVFVECILLALTMLMRHIDADHGRLLPLRSSCNTSKNCTSSPSRRSSASLCLALFVQTMVSNKFIGHGIVIGVFVLQPVLFNFGLGEHALSPGNCRLTSIPT